jgi:PAS domain S-box-containing protein
MAFTRMVEKEQLPYDCEIASSLAQARQMLSEERFDIIVSDYMLGDGTGLDLLKSAGKTPVIFVTGAGDEEVAVKAWRSGARDYVVKDHSRSYLSKMPIIIENTIKHEKMASRLRLLSHAILSTQDSIYITDLQDRITFVNRAFCQTYAFNYTEIVGKDCNILWNNQIKTGAPGIFYKAVDGWEVGFFHRRKNGSSFPVSLSRSDVKDKDGNEVAFVVVSRDISERMKIESELRMSNRQLTRNLRRSRELIFAACERLEPRLKEAQEILTTAGAKVDSAIGESLQAALEQIQQASRIVTILSETNANESSDEEPGGGLTEEPSQVVVSHDTDMENGSA